MSKFSVGLWGRLLGKRPAIEVPSASGSTIRREVTGKWPSTKEATGHIFPVDSTIRANRLVNSILEQVAQSSDKLVQSDPNLLDWVLERVDLWLFCLTAASIGLATVHEKVPGIVEAIDQVLSRKSPPLRNAVANFIEVTFRRERRAPSTEIPAQIGFWVLQNAMDTSLPADINQDKVGERIGTFCIRISSSWEIEREPSLLILRFKTAAIKNHLPLVCTFPELDSIELDTWEFLFTIASLTALTLQPGGDEILTDGLGSELRAFHPKGVDALGDCASFVGRSLSSARDDSTNSDAAVAFYLGIWVLWNGFDRQPTDAEHDLATAVGELVLTTALEV